MSAKDKAKAFMYVGLGVLALGSVWLPRSSRCEPVQWPIEEGGNNHFYAAVESDLDWVEAQDAATSTWWQGMQGHLVTITSQAENDWIWQAFSGPYQYWLGGFQPEGSPEPAGEWTWVTGEPWMYENWYTFAPNDSNGGEDFLEFIGYADGTWNDVPLWTYIRGYIIEFDEYVPIATELNTWGKVKSLYR